MSAHDDAMAAALLAGWFPQQHAANVGALKIAINAYVSTLRAAGYVVTKVPDERDWRHTESAAQGFKVKGWNDCRAEMLANAVEVRDEHA